LKQRKGIPLTPTIVALVGIGLSVFLLSSNSRGAILMKLGDFELQTNMVGFAVFAAVLVYVAYIIRIAYIGGKRSRREIPFYDPRSPHDSRENIECYDCGKEMSRSQRVGPNCGHERPPF
jgi:hypothetical protein